MVRSIALLGQILRKIPAGLFDELAEKHKVERNAKGFSSWAGSRTHPVVVKLDVAST
jgi:hypothetical protein